MNTQKLWSAAQDMFERMRAAIGDVASRTWIGPRERRDIHAWLAPLIAMARKIVFIEAAALARSTQSLAPFAVTRASKPHKRSAAIRLWPKAVPPRARVRQLGPPILVRDIWRDQAHAAAAQHLNKVRLMRPPAQVMLTRRIEALARLIAKPLAAARRLARKLRLTPRIARRIGAKRLPRTHLFDCPEYGAAETQAFAAAMAFDSS
jgi:hypothetical protein